MTIEGKVIPSQPHSAGEHGVEFNWGEQSLEEQGRPGADRLAICLLTDALGDEKAGTLFCLGGFADFVEDIVVKLDREWEITSMDIEEWLAYTCGTGYSAQSSGLAPPPIVKNPNYRLQSNV